MIKPKVCRCCNMDTTIYASLEYASANTPTILLPEMAYHSSGGVLYLKRDYITNTFSNPIAGSYPPIGVRYTQIHVHVPIGVALSPVSKTYSWGTASRTALSGAITETRVYEWDGDSWNEISFTRTGSIAFSYTYNNTSTTSRSEDTAITYTGSGTSRPWLANSSNSYTRNITNPYTYGSAPMTADPSSYTGWVTWGSIEYQYEYGIYTEGWKSAILAAPKTYTSWGTAVKTGSMIYTASYKTLSSIVAAKARLKHAPTHTCYLKMWARLSTILQGTTTQVLTELTPYEWTGGGTPCWDSSYPITAPENTVTGTEWDIIANVPGVTTLQVYKYALIPDYTPPDDGSANGFPI